MSSRSPIFFFTRLFFAPAFLAGTFFFGPIRGILKAEATIFPTAPATAAAFPATTFAARATSAPLVFGAVFFFGNTLFFLAGIPRALTGHSAASKPAAITCLYSSRRHAHPCCAQTALGVEPRRFFRQTHLPFPPKTPPARIFLT